MKTDHTLQPGQVCMGIVTAVGDRHLDIDLGEGVHGTVTSANLSWMSLDHPSQAARVGQSVTIVFLSADPDRGTISLSLKDVEPDPLIEFARTELGKISPGIVTKLTPIGAFVRLPSGIEALLPHTESETEGPEGFKVGDACEVKVDYINVHRRQVRVSLSPRRDPR
ncbi:MULTISPECIES: S1 RNA-binding domain-containing protein [unclassified Streptomyces]|uniref:S1 RNA-binding domain-containing protein n=1 Tax=unclassified Streptomyces TaxID=2593676 RepID=UPI002E12A776|nr:S1 RNA-binding domain-containing protein [Streptomyces sp. NBC_01207]WTA20259.1 S1 RNA-binding domain-containing protein [Streptomyces sp. NBC_00853]